MKVVTNPAIAEEVPDRPPCEVPDACQLNLYRDGRYVGVICFHENWGNWGGTEVHIPLATLRSTDWKGVYRVDL